MGASGGSWATDPKIASALHFIPQGISADLIATKYGYTRSRCDEVALRSQALAAQAVREGDLTQPDRRHRRQRARRARRR